MPTEIAVGDRIATDDGHGTITNVFPMAYEPGWAVVIRLDNPVVGKRWLSMQINPEDLAPLGPEGHEGAGALH